MCPVHARPDQRLREHRVDYRGAQLSATLPATAYGYLPLQEPNADTILSTDTKPGVPYQLVVTNSAGLYRYVTDHIVCIQETQLDKILFTIY